MRTVEQSKAINSLKGPAIVMATSGMCTAGRIKHHLAQTIGRPECTILFVGYQAAGTLGRQILDGNREVRVLGRSMWVREDRRDSGLFRACRPPRPARLAGAFHHCAAAGIRDARRSGIVAGPGQRLRTTKGWNATVPEYQQVVDLG